MHQFFFGIVKLPKAVVHTKEKRIIQAQCVCRGNNVPSCAMVVVEICLRMLPNPAPLKFGTAKNSSRHGIP